jgi:hypothetical protein
MSVRESSRRVRFFVRSKASEAKVVCFMAAVQIMTSLFYRLRIDQSFLTGQVMMYRCRWKTKLEFQITREKVHAPLNPGTRYRPFSVSDRIALAQEIWDSIAESVQSVPPGAPEGHLPRCLNDSRLTTQDLHEPN